MKVLVIGSGGREHALCWKISQGREVGKIYCAPGNAGTSEAAENVDVSAEDLKGLLKFALENKIDLTVVGPEVPLVMGIVDLFEKNGLRIFGPCKAAAMLEGSKAFAKEVMVSAGVPTARFEILDESYSDKKIGEVVSRFDSAAVKADGLAAGKGVFICRDKAEIWSAIDKIFSEKAFGGAGKKIVIEELLDGEEASMLAFCDGKTAKLMVSSQDYKRIFDEDWGDNTGGMGAYAPAPVTEGLDAEIMKKVFVPVLAEMTRRGCPYKGVLYAGLMIKKGENGRRDFKVLEFNARFGDPETQAMLPLLESDLAGVMEACIRGLLGSFDLKWKKGAACCVVLSSKGYPGKYKTGIEIFGLDAAKNDGNVAVFHAGTKEAGGKVVTNGGRVIGVTGTGLSIRVAIDNAYKGVSEISFEGMHFRKDIGRRALGKGA
ncbi:Phosphoribosylamine--glycine ligase [uncultured archaeon]|nr:Phosphoribosylamine--glycine ligase [uncultured archaeon]